MKRYLIPLLATSLILLVVTNAKATNYKKHDHEIDIHNNVDVLHETSVLRNNDITNVILQPPEVTTTGYGDGVYCPEPTLGGAIYGDNNNVGVGISIATPLSALFGKKCPMGEIKMIEQEMKMIKMCNELHQTNWVSEASRVHEVCDRYMPTHKHNSPDYNGNKKRVSTHNR